MHYQRAQSKFKTSLIHIDPAKGSMIYLSPSYPICRYDTDRYMDGWTQIYFYMRSVVVQTEKGEGQTMTAPSYTQENETQVHGDGNSTNSLQVDEVGVHLMEMSHVSLLQNVKVG